VFWFAIQNDVSRRVLMTARAGFQQRFHFPNLPPDAPFPNQMERDRSRNARGETVPLF
jgi:hypothetical protein